jgi:hypothetical protein
MHEQAVKSGGLGRQMLFTVPFLLSSVPPQERAPLLAGAPLPLRVVYRLSRRSHRRLARAAFGGHALAGVAW